MPVKHVDSNISVPSGYGLAEAIYNVASQYTNKFAHESGSNILTFDGDCQVNFNDRVIGLKVGDTVYYNLNTAWDPGYGPITVTSFYTDTICLFELYWTRWGDLRRLYLLFVTKDGKKIVLFNQDARYYDVNSNSNLAIDLKSTADTSYKIRAIASVSQPPASPNILFIDSAIFTNFHGNFIVVDDLKSCSDVTLFSEPIINGKHYFALGTNTLIEVDS